jgi:hypothetical protein
MEDKLPLDPEVQRTYYGIREAVVVETSTGQGSLRELITRGRSQNFRWTVIAVVCQTMQQLTGINLVAQWVFQRCDPLWSKMRFQQLRCTLYHHVIYCGNTDITQTILFQRLGLSDVNARITAAANGTEYFLASFIAYYTIDYADWSHRSIPCDAALGHLRIYQQWTSADCEHSPVIRL